MSEQIKAIEFKATVWAIKTLVDGSVQLVLMIPEYQLAAAKELLGWHRDEVDVLIARQSQEKKQNLYGL